MPIPLFLVYDGSETYLDAVTVCHHVNALDNQEEQHIVALSAFLRECMTSRNQRDSNTYSTSQVFMASSSPAERAQGVQKLLTSFPSLKAEDAANRNPTTSLATEPNAVLMAALLKYFTSQASASVIIPAAATVMKDKFGMSRIKLDTMLKFYGLNTGEETHLPKYLELMHEKNVSDS